MKKIKEDSVILKFKDDIGTIHEVSLSSILEGGIPIDEESEEDMEHISTHLLD